MQFTTTSTVFSDTKAEFLELIKDSNKLILEYIPSNYLKLSPVEVAEATGHITTFFESLEISIEQSSTWNKLADSIDKHSWAIYYDGHTFNGPSSNRKVNTCLSELIGAVLFLRIVLATYKYKSLVIEEVLRHGFFENVCILTDDDLKDSKTDFGAIPSLDLIQNLARIKRLSGTHGEFSFFLFFDFTRQRIFKMNRNRSLISEWAKSQIDLLSPKLRLKNRAQKERLRTYFLNLMEQSAIEISDVDKFLATKFFVDSPNSFVQAYSSVEPGSDVSASQLIRGLYIELRTVCIFNSNRDIQKWIFNLFIDHEASGFSFHNVKKVTEQAVIEKSS